MVGDGGDQGAVFGEGGGLGEDGQVVKLVGFETVEELGKGNVDGVGAAGDMEFIVGDGED